MLQRPQWNKDAEPQTVSFTTGFNPLLTRIFHCFYPLLSACRAGKGGAIADWVLVKTVFQAFIYLPNIESFLSLNTKDPKNAEIRE